MDAKTWLANHQEAFHLRPDERWVYSYLQTRADIALEPKAPSDILRHIGDLVGYWAANDKEMSHGLRGLCKALTYLVRSRGDRWC